MICMCQVWTVLSNSFIPLFPHPFWHFLCAQSSTTHAFQERWSEGLHPLKHYCLLPHHMAFQRIFNHGFCANYKNICLLFHLSGTLRALVNLKNTTLIRTPLAHHRIRVTAENKKWAFSLKGQVAGKSLTPKSSCIHYRYILPLFQSNFSFLCWPAVCT